MGFVVHPGAENFVRVGNDGQKADVGQSVVRLCRRGLAHVVERTARGNAILRPVKKNGSSEIQITFRAMVRSLAPMMRAMLTRRWSTPRTPANTVMNVM